MNHAALYKQIEQDLEGYLTSDWLSNLANFSAVVFNTLPDLNWCGFYLVRKGKLMVGPFQGKPACDVIEFGRGVCGAAATQKKTIVVPDVDKFADHIVCDSASRSEVVIPMIKDGTVIGVLDIDSPTLARFTNEDAAALEKIVALLMTKTAWPQSL